MASASLGTLTIDLVARIGGFVEGLSKAERESKKFRSKVEKDLKDFGKAISGFAVAGAAATAALIKSSIDNADALLAQSQMYGVNIELLSGYQLGLEQAESSSADLATGLKGLANAVDSNSEAFARLQISTRNSDGSLKESNDLLEEIAGRFASMPDGITKTALAQDLLGKSGIKLIPFLNEGADGLRAMREESEKLGKVISLETAQAADKFNDNLSTLKAVITGTGNELAATLLPKMIEFTNTVNDPSTQQGIKDIVTGLAEMAIQLTKIVTAIPNVTRFLAEELAAFTNGAALGDLPRLNEELAELNEQLAYAAKTQLFTAEKVAEWEAERNRVQSLIDLTNELAEGRATLSSTSSAGSSSAPAAPFVPLSASDIKDTTDAQNEWNKAMEAALDEAEKTIAKLQAIDDQRLALNEGMERELALYGETSQAAILRYDIEHGELAALTEENKAYSIALAEQLDIKKALADEAANDEQFAAKEAALQKEIDLIGNVSEAAELLYDIEHGGYEQFDEDQQAKLVLLAEELEAREAMMKEIEAQEKAKAEVMEEFSNRTQNILADFLKGSFDDGFDGVVDRFKQLLADLAAEAVAADIMKFVTGLGKNADGSSNGWGKAIASFAGLFDGGGMIPAGQWGIAGENGAEIIRGPANITSTKDTAALMGKGGNNFTNTFVFPNVRTKEEAQQAGSAAARQINRMNSGSGRYG
jgi:hypothetical protein